MKIFYDYQILFLQKWGGISRYFYEIIGGLRTNYKEIEMKLPIVFSNNYYFSDMIKCRRQLPKGNRFLNEVISIVTLRYSKIINKPFDIIHPTFFYPEYLLKNPSLKGNSKLIVTVHDMIYEIFMPEKADEIEQKREVISLADGLICVSEYTKKDLLRIYPFIDAKKVKVIYHGNSMNVSDDVKVEIKLPEQYLLFVGVRDGYKNFKVLLEAFPLILKAFPKLHLICVGGGTFVNAERQFIEEHQMKDSIQQMSLTDDELYCAYKNAQCFIFPSLYEGFGIPILESFYSGCPMILSDRSCFYEIAGDAAMYFEGDKPFDIVDKVKILLSEDNLRQQFIERGKERLKEFSWEKATEETYEFYNEVLNK